MGSNITYRMYALILPHSYERRPEDDLKKDRNILPLSDKIIIYYCCVFEIINCFIVIQGQFLRRFPKVAKSDC